MNTDRCSSVFICGFIHTLLLVVASADCSQGNLVVIILGLIEAVLAIGMLYWAFTSPRYREVEGKVDGCFAIAGYVFMLFTLIMIVVAIWRAADQNDAAVRSYLSGLLSDLVPERAIVIAD